MLAGSKFLNVASLPVPGSLYGIPISPENISMFHLARLWSSSTSDNGARSEQLNVYLTLKGRKWVGEERKQVFQVGPDLSATPSEVAALLQRHNQRRYEVEIEPWLLPPGGITGQMLAEPGESTRFFTIEADWTPGRDIGKYPSALGTVVDAPLVPHFALRTGVHHSIRLVYLLESPSSDFGRRTVLQDALAQYFGGAINEDNGIPDSMPVAGTAVFDSKGSEIFRVELWESGQSNPFSLSQLETAFT